MRRNKDWLSADSSLWVKLSYYPIASISLLLSILGIKSSVKYLHNNFYFDNKYMPLILMHYPHEISNKILKHMSSPPKNVLDIGGNIGQFICTLAYLGDKNMKADVFEPNTSIFPLLKKNTANHKGIRIFNYGVGKKGELDFYFEKGRTAIGGMLKANAGSNIINSKVNVISDISKITKKKQYDLIKIDVEGYEYELIKHLIAPKTKYLFLEISTINRDKNYDHSELFKLIEQKFGPYDVLNMSELAHGKVIFDAFFRFK